MNKDDIKLFKDLNKQIKQLDTKLDTMNMHIIELSKCYTKKPTHKIKPSSVNNTIKNKEFKNLKVNEELFDSFIVGMNKLLDQYKVVLLKNLPDFFPTIGNSTIHRYYKLFTDMYNDVEMSKLAMVGSKAIYRTKDKEFFLANIDKLCKKSDLVFDTIENHAKELCKEQTSFTINDIAPKVRLLCGMGKLRTVLHDIEWLGKSSDSIDNKMFCYFDITEEKTKREELKKLCATRSKLVIDNKNSIADTKKKKFEFFDDVPHQVWDSIEAFSYFDINDRLQFIFKFALFDAKGFNLLRWNSGMVHKTISTQDFNDFCNDVIKNQIKILKLCNKQGKFILKNQTFIFAGD